MTTKIFVSQIDRTNSDGSTANVGSYIVLGNTGPFWTDNLSYIPTGYQGSAGNLGPTGYTGSAGYEGPVGYQGSAGTVGFQGSQGLGGTGYTGSLGDTGYMGSAGFTGSQGAGGAGYDGSVGFQGSVGDVGYQGSAGAPGGGGSIAFTDLKDVPNTYTASAFLKVNAAATGVEFDTSTYLTNNITTDVSFNSANLVMSYNYIKNPIISGYGENINDLGNVTNVGVNFTPLSTGNIVKMTLADAVVGITINNTGMVSNKLYTVTLFLTQDATGGRAVDWTGMTVYWPTSENIPAGGPVLSTDPNYTDVIVLYTLNAGTSWYGVLSLKGYAG